MNSDNSVSKKRSVTPFRDAVRTNENDKQLGENGMPEFASRQLGSNVLSISQQVRGGNAAQLVDAILEGKNANEIADLFVLIFLTRNCRGGKGEKKLAHDIFLRVWQSYPKTCSALLTLFPNFGYWKDLVLLMRAAKNDLSNNYAIDLTQQCVTIMFDQFKKDILALEHYKSSLACAVDEEEIDSLKMKGPAISLLSKWLPRERSSFDKTTKFVNLFSSLMVQSSNIEKEWQSSAKASYRRQVAELTSYLSLPEVLLAAQREEEIHFGKLAARATMRLRRVFMNENKDGSVRSQRVKRIRLSERFTEHVVGKGLKGAQLMPHELVEQILRTGSMSALQEQVFDAQWKNLSNSLMAEIKGKSDERNSVLGHTHMVPLCDVSGSMSGTPMSVAIALSILISEHTHDSFKGLILTFESQPRWHALGRTDSIVKKVRSLAGAPWGGSTDFEAAHSLVLEIAEAKRLAREDLPHLIVFSDMQFNLAGDRSVGSMETMHENIARKHRSMAIRLGWHNTNPLPTIFWNLRNSGGQPAESKTEGAVLLSGFSPSLLKFVMYGEALLDVEVEVVEKDGNVTTEKVCVSPSAILREMLDDGIYNSVRNLVKESAEN